MKIIIIFNLLGCLFSLIVYWCNACGLIYMLSISRLKKFLGEQSRNYRVLLVRGVAASFLDQLTQNFSNLYIVELGASPVELGGIRAIGSAVSALFSIPAGWLSDVYSVKRILIVGMLIQILSIAFFAFAQNWLWIVVAVILQTLTMTLVWRIQNIIIANSLSDRDRATGYGLRTTLMQLFSVTAPTIGGFLVYLFGGISVEGIRPLYYIQLVGIIIVSIYVAFSLEDIRFSAEMGARRILAGFREVFSVGRGLKRFAFIQALGSITWGMSMPFPFVYAVEFKGADSLTIGYMGTCQTLISMLLALPLGRLADSRGRKFTIYLTRPFFYGSFLLLVLAPPSNPYVLLLAWALRGVMMGSNAWMTMSMELVPPEYRGRWTGVTSLLQNLTRVPAMLIGGYLYQDVDPNLVFIIPIIIDLFIRMPILKTVPETLKK
ncbi:MAG: MFS transporter [archaeon GB-1867-035]|nr:MFS transporter [Candidatus Culexmicrobium profundum]